jgi:hypothetical protein
MSEQEMPILHSMINDMLHLVIKAHDVATSNCVLISFDWINDSDVRSKSKLCFVDEGCGIMAVQVFLQVMLEGCDEATEDFSNLKRIIQELKQHFERTSHTLFASEEHPKQ